MLRLSTSINFLFGEHAFTERFAAAREAGFSGVEIQFLEASDSEVARAASDAGVEVVLLNASMGDLLGGGPGLSGVPGREQEFADAVFAAADTALAVGAEILHLGPSLVPADESRERCLATYLGNVNRVLRHDAFTSGRVTPVLEPMNSADMPTALFTDYREAAELLQREFGGLVGLQYDIYHIEKGGASAAQLWPQLRQQIRHVQFSDVPDRGAPGTGSLDFPGLFKMIADSDYGGWTGAEYFPAGATLDSLGWLGELA